MPQLLAQLRAFGIVSPSGSGASADNRPVRLLGGEPRGAARGASSAAWVTVVVTGARHKAANGFYTRSATHTLPGLAPRLRRAASISSICYGRPQRLRHQYRGAGLHVLRAVLPGDRPLGRNPLRSTQVVWTLSRRLGISLSRSIPIRSWSPPRAPCRGVSRMASCPTVIVSVDAGSSRRAWRVLGPAERLVHKLDIFTKATQGSAPNARADLRFYRDQNLSPASDPAAQGRPAGTVDRIFTRRPASSPSTVCSHGSMPTSTNC